MTLRTKGRVATAVSSAVGSQAGVSGLDRRRSTKSVGSESAAALVRKTTDALHARARAETPRGNVAERSLDEAAASRIGPVGEEGVEEEKEVD